MANIEKYGPENLNNWEWHYTTKTANKEDVLVSWNQTKKLYEDHNKKQFWFQIGDTVYRNTVDCRYRTVRGEASTIYYNSGARPTTGQEWTNQIYKPIDTVYVRDGIADQVCRKFY